MFVTKKDFESALEGIQEAIAKLAPAKEEPKKEPEKKAKEEPKKDDDEVTIVASSSEDVLKQNAAYKAVLKAHDISFDVSKADLSTLSVDGDKVKGQLNYSIPSPQTKLPDQGGDKKSLSFDDVKGMSADQINANWKEVSQILAQEGAN